MPVHPENFPSALRTVAIYGPGLIGGSLALALRGKADDVRVWARRAEAARETERAVPGCKAFTSVEQAAEGADFVVFCTPVGAMPEIAGRIGKHLATGAVVTDAGSVKGTVVKALEPIFGGAFVGSHPMAGSERSGLAAARGDLFEGAACVVTPTKTTAPETVERVCGLWTDVGCRIIEMPPEEHDRAAARISHLPHAVAAALVNSIEGHAPESLRLAGGGYRDTTRIAAGPEGMWREILLENKAELLAGLEDFTEMIEELKTHLSEGNGPALEKFLARAAKFRRPTS